VSFLIHERIEIEKTLNPLTRINVPMKTVIVNGIILTPDEQITGYQVVIENDRIAGVDPAGPVDSAFIRLDARGSYVIPGFIDIHIHGANGFDTMDATPDAIQNIGRFIAGHGVTSFLPTTVTASPEDTISAIRNISNTPAPQDGARHLGIHLEGPYLNYDYRGAQPVQHLRSANPNEFKSWLENKVVRLITVAPEIEGVPNLIQAGAKAGIEFSLGHTGATYEQALTAVELGLSQATHTFNGMAPLQHRSPGALGAVLSEDRIKAQIIVDGIHVHPAIVKFLVKTKGIDHTILITDAIRAAGLPDGDYRLGDQLVHVQDGIARTHAGGLAGSTLTMDQALRNMMKFANINFMDALPMATSVPATAIGLKSKKGRIAPNFDADIIFLDETYHVRMTMVGGRVVYRSL
jgi:N-acetylglucosamine-6-phosphate deacetylase